MLHVLSRKKKTFTTKAIGRLRELVGFLDTTDGARTHVPIAVAHGVLVQLPGALCRSQCCYK